MLNVLLERLVDKPDMYQDEMVDFLYDEFEVWVMILVISRALKSARWSKKVARRIAWNGTRICETFISTSGGVSFLSCSLRRRVWL